MLKIFARNGTSEKALVYCDRGNVSYVIGLLCEQYGGVWALVDVIDTNRREILKFDDGLRYIGYNNIQKRYCTAIDKLKY